VNRRRFLGTLLAAVAAPIVPAARVVPKFVMPPVMQAVAASVMLAAGGTKAGWSLGPALGGALMVRRGVHGATQQG